MLERSLLMKKYFNTTGLCIPELHYMVNIDNKLDKISALIDRGSYFVINKPRQYGKTTTLNSLESKISGKYIVISLSFEGLGDVVFDNEKAFSNKFLHIMTKSLKYMYAAEFNILKRLSHQLEDLQDLSDVISDFVESCDRDVVLFIDEVDKSSNNQLFLSFLDFK